MVVVVVATIVALTWMCYRVSTLLNIPIPTLVKLLGLDLPAPPRVSLHGVNDSTITLHWSLPERAGSVAKHIIQINGINVGESEKRGETSVTVTGLNPDQRYNVRVIAANTQNFQAPGPLIRLRTRKKKEVGVEEVGKAGGVEVAEETLEVPSTPPAREFHHAHSQQQHHGHAHGKRGGKERRNSPATMELQQREFQHQSGDTVESLTKELDGVRREIHDLETQLQHSESEFRAQESVLRAELDTLKDKKNSEDAVRARLRAETKTLEESRRVAEATRTRTEKALRQKETEIRKMKDDVSRWEQERIVALEKIDELKQAAEESKENAATTEKELEDDIKEAQGAIQDMEEDIRKLVASLKALEARKEELKAQEEEYVRRAREDSESEKQWKVKREHFEAQYLNVYHKYHAAQVEYEQSQESLRRLQHRRGSGELVQQQQKKQKTRRHRTRKSRQTVSSLPSYQIGEYNSAFSNTSYPQIPSGFGSGSSSTFFNINNGTAPGDVSGVTVTSNADDIFSGSAPMSPTANLLLPSNLFGQEDGIEPMDERLSIKSASIGEDGRPNSYVAPQSPMSSGSVSTSPRSSFNQLPLYPTISADPALPSLDADKRASPISPIGTNRPLPATSTDESSDNPTNGGRFVRLFSNSFGRQRGKTVNDAQPPLLGSLKPSETHSFPETLADLPPPPGLSPIGARRRSGSYGSWTSTLGNSFLPSRREGTRGLERANTTSSDTRKNFVLGQFKPFGPTATKSIFDTPGSPRPSSIASFENALPAPSEDTAAAFGWPAPVHGPVPAPGGKVNVFGGFGNNWSDFASGRLSRSRPVSRPISPQGNGSTASLSLLPSQQQLAVGFYPPATSSPLQTAARPITPRLNPTAPSFEIKNIPKSDPDAAAEKEGDAMSTHSNVSTAGTNSGLSLESVPTKESILSRFSISRKGSTGKFNLSSWKLGKNRKDAAASDAEDSVVEETGSEAGTPNPNKESKGLWSGWRKRDEESTTSLVDELTESEREGITPATTPLARESQPWTKGSQPGFFGTIGRRREDKDRKEDVESESEEAESTGASAKKEEKKAGLGIFRRRKEKEAPVEGEDEK